MMKQFYRAKLTLEAMHKDFTIDTTNKEEAKPIGDEIAGDAFMEVRTTEETKEISFEEENDHIILEQKVEVECTREVPRTAIQKFLTKPSLDEAMQRQITRNNRLQNDVVILYSTRRNLVVLKIRD